MEKNEDGHLDSLALLSDLTHPLPVPVADHGNQSVLRHTQFRTLIGYSVRSCILNSELQQEINNTVL